MEAFTYAPLPLGQLATPASAEGADWVWRYYLARGDLTLLTSEWKAGKTTLVSGLLGALDTGRPFLGLATVAASTVIVSEEAPDHWADRRRIHPGGAAARLVSRPFPGRPTAESWDALVRKLEDDRTRFPLDLLVVDPLASFLPGRSDADPSTVLDFLHPLRRLAAGGTAVLILHHPRKKPAEAGSKARGTGALVGFVDTVCELERTGWLAAEANRRRLTARSRRPEPIPPLVYDWVPGTDAFRVVADGADARYRENREAVLAQLADRRGAVSHRELLAGWPEGCTPPTPRELYDWLNRAVREGELVRHGRGTKADPYRFGLPVTGRDPLPRLGPL